MSSRPIRPRAMLGVPLTAQSVALLAASLLLVSLVAVAVLSWLERTG